MQNQVTLFNQALSLTGDRQLVSSPTENSGQANICRLWFDPCRRAVFAAASWPCATSYINLALVRERDFNTQWADGNPAPGFKYAYVLPADCVAPRNLSTWAPFKLGTIGDDRVLFTNSETPVLEYTRDISNPAIWEQSLYMAVVYFLAAHINQPRNGKDNSTERLFNRAKEIVDSAGVAVANEEDSTYDATPDFLAARGYCGPVGTTRFFYKNQGLVMGAL